MMAKGPVDANDATTDQALLHLSRVSKSYRLRSHRLYGRTHETTAVDNVSLSVFPARSVALVGESGSGKTTTARMALGLVRPDNGTVSFRGAELQSMNRRQTRTYRSSVQAVFQDPWSSLNPRMRIGDSIGEPLLINGRLSRPAIRDHVSELLVTVGLSASQIDNFPHEFSGGQRQRIAIARALSVDPAIVVLDEPVSGLDVSIRAQILNTLRELQLERGITYLLIAHDFATVRYLAAAVAVMYLGAVVEIGPTDLVLDSPGHPYTAALIASSRAGWLDDATSRQYLLGMEISPYVGVGCRFRPRCPLYQRLGRPKSCETDSPVLRASRVGLSEAACHFTEHMDSSADAYTDQEALA